MRIVLRSIYIPMHLTSFFYVALKYARGSVGVVVVVFPLFLLLAIKYIINASPYINYFQWFDRTRETR